MTWPTVNVIGELHAVVALLFVFVVSGLAAVGESLQPLAIAPPRSREAHAIRDNIDLYLQGEARRNGRTGSYWQVKRPCGSGSVQFCVVPSWVITTFAVAVPS